MMPLPFPLPLGNLSVPHEKKIVLSVSGIFGYYKMERHVSK